MIFSIFISIFPRVNFTGDEGAGGGSHYSTNDGQDSPARHLAHSPAAQHAEKAAGETEEEDGGAFGHDLFLSS
jgi:hypothetical protein